MTGFGAGESAGPPGRFRAELRAVNARFLELKPRLPAMLTPYEAELRRMVGDAVRRGRIDLAVSWEPSEGVESSLRVDIEVARAYLEAADRLRGDLLLPGEIGLVQMLSLPGVVEAARSEPASPELKELAFEAVGTALRGMDAMRRAEGEATVVDLTARLEALSGLRRQILSRADAVPSMAQKRLQERLARLGVDPTLDPARLAQEVAYLAERSDIAEELARLDAHLERCRGLLVKEDEPVGKSLEFVAQELHRETNTIGSKTQDADIAGWILEMKTEIERIREQAQNLE